MDLVQAPAQVEPLAQEWADQNELVATTVINVYESLLGAYALRNREKGSRIEDKLTRAMARMQILPLRDEAARNAARVAGGLRREGLRLGVDALVACVAVDQGCDSLVTRNVRHFRPLGEALDLTVIPY